MPNLVLGAWTTWVNILLPMYKHGHGKERNCGGPIQKAKVSSMTLCISWLNLNQFLPQYSRFQVTFFTGHVQLKKKVMWIWNSDRNLISRTKWYQWDVIFQALCEHLHGCRAHCLSKKVPLLFAQCLSLEASRIRYQESNRQVLWTELRVHKIHMFKPSTLMWRYLERGHLRR